MVKMVKNCQNQSVDTKAKKLNGNKEQETSKPVNDSEKIPIKKGMMQIECDRW